MPGLMDLMGYRDDSDAPGLAQVSAQPVAGGMVNAIPMGQAPAPQAAPTMTAVPPAMGVPPGAQNAALAAGATRPAMPQGAPLGQAPQRGFWDGFRAGAVGPGYAEAVYQGKVNDYRNKVIGGVLKNLVGSRDPNLPMTWQDVQQAVGGVDPSLMGSKKFLTGMGYIMQDWNNRIAGRTQNQFNTARMYGAQINDPTTIQNFNRFGYMTPGQGAAQGQARQNRGGLMDMDRPGRLQYGDWREPMAVGQSQIQFDPTRPRRLAEEGGPVMAPGWGMAQGMPQAAPRAFTLPKQSAKALAFPGAVNNQVPANQGNSLTIPRDADMKFGDDMRTAQGKAAVNHYANLLGLPLAVKEARLKAHASQQEQTQGHKDRRMYDQATPGGTYVTRTDPNTGRQYREWTSGAQSYDLGNKPQTLNQMDADLVRRGFAAYGKGKQPQDVLNPGEYKRYENAMKSQSSLEEIAKLLFVGNKAGMAKRRRRKPNL